jgi:hypothetical protein
MRRANWTGIDGRGTATATGRRVPEKLTKLVRCRDPLGRAILPHACRRQDEWLACSGHRANSFSKGYRMSASAICPRGSGAGGPRIALPTSTPAFASLMKARSPTTLTGAVAASAQASQIGGALMCPPGTSGARGQFSKRHRTCAGQSSDAAAATGPWPALPSNHTAIVP